MPQLLKLPTSRRGGLTLERALLRGPRGTTALRQRLSGCAERVIITHDACLAAIVDVISGRLSFVVAGRTLRPPDRFIMVVPPRALVRMRFERAVVHTDGLGAFDRLTGAPRVCGAKAGIALELDTLLAGEPLFEMPSDAAVDAGTARARRLLHECLGELAPVRRTASAIGLAPDTLTRAFSKAYGITPKHYCTRARLFDAVLRLLAGGDVMQTALSVQFGDLSRFYAQFRRALGATPGSYARIGKHQDRARTRG